MLGNSARCEVIISLRQASFLIRLARPIIARAPPLLRRSRGRDDCVASPAARVRAWPAQQQRRQRQMAARHSAPAMMGQD